MGSLLVLISAFGFSTVAIFGKIAYDLGFSRNQMQFWRFGISFVFMIFFLVLSRAFPQMKKPEIKKSFILAFFLGMVGIGIEATLYFLTLERVGAALTAIFLYLYPTGVALISHFFLKSKLGSFQWFCVFLSLLGCFLTVDLPNNSNLESGSQLGILFGVLTGVWYAIYLLVGDRILKNSHPTVVSTGISLGAFFAFFVLSVIDILQDEVPLKHLFEYPSQASFGAATLTVLGLGFLASALPITTLYAGMKRVGPTKAAILSTFELISTVVLAVLILDEKLTLIQVCGATFILASVLLIHFKASSNGPFTQA